MNQNEAVIMVGNFADVTTADQVGYTQRTGIKIKANANLSVVGKLTYLLIPQQC